MKPNKLIRLALWLSRYSYGNITVNPVGDMPEVMIVIGKRGKR